MNDVKTAAVERAIKILQAAKARYHIVLETGEQFGEPINPPKPKKTKRYRAGPENAAIIKAAFDSMEIGDVCVLEPQEGDTAKRLRNNCISYAGNRWGSGTSIEAIVTPDNKVEILRVS